MPPRDTRKTVKIMKTYDGKTISKKHIVEVLRTMDLTAICRLYKQVNGSVPTSTEEVDGADKIRKHLNTFAVLDWTYQFATSRWMRTDLRELFYSPKAGLKPYYDQVYSLTLHGHYKPLQKGRIIAFLKEQCQDPVSNYAKRPMLGHTHLYFCSPVYGHSDYNKWRALPIKGNERFCELVIKYADRFFGPIYDK